MVYKLSNISKLNLRLTLKLERFISSWSPHLWYCCKIPFLKNIWCLNIFCAVEANSIELIEYLNDNQHVWMWTFCRWGNALFCHTIIFIPFFNNFYFLSLKMIFLSLHALMFVILEKCMVFSRLANWVGKYFVSLANM